MVFIQTGLKKNLVLIRLILHLQYMYMYVCLCTVWGPLITPHFQDVGSLLAAFNQ
jgi:hypothetical protein